MYICIHIHVYVGAGRIFSKITSSGNEREEVTPAVRYSPRDRRTSVIYKKGRLKKKERRRESSLSSDTNDETEGFLFLNLRDPEIEM